MGKKYIEDNIEKLRKQRDDNVVGGYRDLVVKTYKYIQKVKSPILIIHGDIDSVIPFEASQQLSKLLKKGSEFYPITNQGHDDFEMNELFESKITDYLIKPLNPNQILLSVKKILDNKRLITEKTNLSYQQEFRKIAMDMSMVNSYEEWVELYQKLIYWEIQLEDIEDIGMFEILESQKNEANIQFGKFIEKNYADWFKPNIDAPVMSHTLFKEKIAPEISKEQPTLLVVIDNLRYDQWKVFEPIISNYYKKDKEELHAGFIAEDVPELVANGTAKGGMIPKLETAAKAVDTGVEAAVILDGRKPHALLVELFTDHGAGTLIS